jgi:hypothetical protein
MEVQHVEPAAGFALEARDPASCDEPGVQLGPEARAIEISRAETVGPQTRAHEAAHEALRHGQAISEDRLNRLGAIASPHEGFVYKASECPLAEDA